MLNMLSPILASCHPGLPAGSAFLPHIQPLEVSPQKISMSSDQKGPLLCNFFSGSESQNLTQFEIVNIKLIHNVTC